MNKFLLSLLLLSVTLFATDMLSAQSPTPFGTPSLLPVQDQYASWQSDHRVPSMAQPYRQPPSYPPQYSPAYSNSPSVPMQYAANQVPVQGGPHPGPTAPSALHPGHPGAAMVPGIVEGGTPGVNVYTPSDGWGYGCADVCGPSVCGPVAEPCYEPCCGPCFYATAGGLIFTRNRPRFQQVSYDDTNLVGQVLSTDSGMGHWDFGGQATIGWLLNPCCGAALELTYWGIFADEVQSTVYANSLPGNLNTAFDFSPLNIGASNVNDLFDAAQMHQIRRDYDIHNVEVNLWGGKYLAPTCSCFQLSYLAGFRYLRFNEDFFYASADAVPSFGADPANEAYYDIQVDNNLWGFQLGGRADWYVTERFSAYVAPKFGIYGNYMQHTSRIYNGNGTAVVGPGNPLVGGVYAIDSDKTIASFMGEFDLGLSYQFTPCLGASIGYRVVAISGLAYATDQIPSHFADLPGVAMIDSNADMILHGGYAAITLTW